MIYPDMYTIDNQEKFRQKGRRAALNMRTKKHQHIMYIKIYMHRVHQVFWFEEMLVQFIYETFPRA